jgi:hypothetical protein
VTDVVEAARFYSRIDADLARLYLESSGVEAVLFDTGHNSLYGSLGGLFMPVRLMVLAEDLGEAERLLRNYKP